MKRFLTFGFLLVFLIFSPSIGFAADSSFKIWTDIGYPSIVEMKIIPWDSSNTITTIHNGSVINFNNGALGTAYPGKSSGLETPSDGWTSKDANVGFDLLCIGPPASKLYISCGNLIGPGGKAITLYDDYDVGNGKTERRKNFGVTVSRDTASPPVRVYSDVLHNGPVSEANLIHTFGGTEYGHLYHVYNWLNIPAETTPGDYSTSNYVITFI